MGSDGGPRPAEENGPKFPEGYRGVDGLNLLWLHGGEASSFRDSLPLRWVPKNSRKEGILLF